MALPPVDSTPSPNIDPTRFLSRRPRIHNIADDFPPELAARIQAQWAAENLRRDAWRNQFNPPPQESKGE